MEQIYTNLSVVLLDDDDMSLLHLKQLITSNNQAMVVGVFTDPTVFLRQAPALHFDILILNCEMPGASAKEVVEIIGCERCIISTGSKDKYEEAIKCHPIDIMIKPPTQLDVMRTLNKARKIITPSAGKDYYLFKTLEHPDKISIRIQDIIYIFTHNNSRRKTMLMRNGASYTLSDYTMDELLEIAPHLLRPNQSELVAIDMIQCKGYDHVYLTISDKLAKHKWTPIGRSFIKEFNAHYKRCSL